MQQSRSQLYKLAKTMGWDTPWCKSKTEALKDFVEKNQPEPEVQPEPEPEIETKIEQENISDNISEMDFEQPDLKEYSSIYRSKYGNSIEDDIDLKTYEGHIFRNSKNKKFYIFDSIFNAGTWFNGLDKPSIHSVVNKYKPIRFNLELDIDYDKLNNIILPEAHLQKMKDDGMIISVNKLKYYGVIFKVKSAIVEIIEEHYKTSIEFIEATDNRAGKFSHRLYADLAFASLHEYKWFCQMLKDKVSDSIVPMIDPTTSMLRTPGSYKDDHVCRWETDGADFTHSILTNTDDCEELIRIAPEEINETYDSIEGVLGKALNLICSHPLVAERYAYTGSQRNNMITLKRIAPSYCEICCREHNKIDAYAWVYKNNVYMGCFNGDKHKHKHLGFIGEEEEQNISWASIRSIFKKLKNKEMLSGLEQKNQLTAWENLQAKAEINRVSENDKYEFDDFKNIHNKTFPDLKPVIDYINGSVFRIVKGGQNFWITRSRWKNQTHFTELSSCPFQSKSENIKFDVVNKDFDPEKPPSKDNQNTISYNLFDVLSEHRKLNFHSTLDFIPYLGDYSGDPKVFNIFQGYRFPYVRKQYGEIPSLAKPWIDHIVKAICNGDEKMAHTVIQWFAHLIQKPTQKSFSLIVLGKEGSGKSILYDIFRQCIGEDLAMQLSKLSDLTQTHNKIVQGRLLVNCNEATNYPSISDVNIVKQFVTDKEFLVNPKGCPLYYVNNYSRLLITTNCRFPMRITPDDRRYLCIEMSDKFKNNDDYFKPMVNMLDNKQALAELFNYLANYDISNFKFNKPPMTEFKREIIGECVDDVYFWIKEIVEDGYSNGVHITTDTKESAQQLYHVYSKWCEETMSKKLGMRKWFAVVGSRKDDGILGKQGRFRVGGGDRFWGFNLNRDNIINNLKEAGVF